MPEGSTWSPVSNSFLRQMIISDAQQHFIHLRGVWILVWSTDFFKYLNLQV